MIYLTYWTCLHLCAYALKLAFPLMYAYGLTARRTA